jgi:DNA (cytosine-5)-methyltransferase 1
VFEAKLRDCSVLQRPEVLETESPFRILSMFAGCGGLDLGFTGGFQYRSERFPRLPTKIIAAYDNDKKAKRTYDTNFSHELTLRDLATAPVDEMPAADILIGGFPCQEFSICGPRGGVDSRRGGLFRTMSRYAKKFQPKLVVAENVAHLERINFGEDMKTILRSLMLAGYRPHVWPVYAPDFGVPQARKRIFIVGVRKDIASELHAPSPLFKEHRSTRWAIDDLQGISDESVPNQSQYFKAALAKKGHGQGDEVNPRDLPAYTIRANGRSRVQFHYELPRRLTVRECARIQTFPDGFKFPDEATPSIRQIGNAVPPVLAFHVANHLIEFLQSAES